VIRAAVTLPPGLPEHTLGWDVLWWTTRYITQPDGPNAGGPWHFTAEQARFVLWWYAIEDDGRWLSTRGVVRRPKGAGKSPKAAAISLAELCGPVRFGGWATGGETAPWRAEPYGRGDPIAVECPAAWVQLAGVSERQTQNTMAMVLAMCAESPIVDDYGLDLGLTRIYTAAGGRLEPITASAPTAEGARPTFINEDETQWWTDSNGGAALDRVNRRNVAKIPGGTGRILETTNAHAAGEQSVAEHTYEAFLAQRDGRIRTGRLLYDTREPDADVDLADEGQLMEALAAAYGDSDWVDLERLRDEVWDPGTAPADTRRFYLNQVSTAVDAWLSEPEWAAVAEPATVVHAGDVVVLGFDGSEKRRKGVADATALIGVRVEDGHVFEIEVWEQPSGPAGWDWNVPVAEVEAAVDHAFDTYDVVGLYADPAQHWDAQLRQWEARYINRLRVKAHANQPMHWHPGGDPVKAVRAAEQFHSAVVNRELTHSGAWRLTAHMLNARRRVRRNGVMIYKEHPESARKIDAAWAAIYAWQARLDAVGAGLTQPAEEIFVPRRIR
jgi:hypothetical protein